MQTLQGKYNKANVLTDSIDKETTSQIYSFLGHPAFKGGYIAIMPDCHAGAGVVIGFTKLLNDYIIPNVVGVDIGCGVNAYNLGKLDVNFEVFDEVVRREVPAGKKTHKDLATLTKVNKYLILSRYASQVESLCKKLNYDYTKALYQLGTLGGGNHFIELDKDDDGNVWLLIHSGSRNLGKTVADYHQKKAKKLMSDMFIGDAYKELEYLPMKFGGHEYLYDMRVAQKHAQENRDTIARAIIAAYLYRHMGKYQSADSVYDELGKIMENMEFIESVHNYIGEDDIIRKGAISANNGERLLIPFNMRDGVLIGIGKGNKKWNYSAPHGAGRLYGRKEAKRVLDLDEFKEDMNGIWTSCINENTLDESPRAYKDKNTILADIEETLTPEKFLTPVYNFKAS